MHSKKTYLFALLLMVGFSACMREKIVLEDFGLDNAMAVTAVLDGNGGLQQIKLSSSQKVIGGTGSSTNPILDATVFVVSEGDTAHFVYENGNDYYSYVPPTPDYFMPNKTYQLFVSALGKKSLSSSCTIPQKYEAVIESAQIKNIPIDSFNYTLNLNIVIQDQANQANFYRIIPQQILVNESNPDDTLVFPLSGNPLCMLNDQEAAQGKISKEFSIAQYTFGIPEYKLVGYAIIVLHCSELYYTYHSKIQKSEEMDDNLNPVFVPGNIQNGYGIFTGVNGIYEKKFFLP